MSVRSANRPYKKAAGQAAIALILLDILVLIDTNAQKQCPVVAIEGGTTPQDWERSGQAKRHSADHHATHRTLFGVKALKSKKYQSSCSQLLNKKQSSGVEDGTIRNRRRKTKKMPISIPFLSEGINAVLQGFQNRANRKFAMKQYSIARKDALSDYNMQNEYNSPASQMERLKQAGLNPNLVYGTGAGSMTAAPIKSAPQNAAQGEAPKVDLGGAVGK